MNNLILRLYMKEFLMCVKMIIIEVIYLIFNEIDNIIWVLFLKFDL